MFYSGITLVLNQQEFMLKQRHGKIKAYHGIYFHTAVKQDLTRVGIGQETEKVTWGRTWKQ